MGRKPGLPRDPHGEEYTQHAVDVLPVEPPSLRAVTQGDLGHLGAPFSNIFVSVALLLQAVGVLRLCAEADVFIDPEKEERRDDTKGVKKHASLLRIESANEPYSVLFGASKPWGVDLDARVASISLTAFLLPRRHPHSYVRMYISTRCERT